MNTHDGYVFRVLIKININHAYSAPIFEINFLSVLQYFKKYKQYFLSSEKHELKYIYI